MRAHLRVIWPAAILVIGTAWVIAGCGLTNPAIGLTASTKTVQPRTSPIPAPERGGRVPAQDRSEQSQLTPGAGATSQISALATYARLWSTWTGRTVAARERELAEMSLGQARAQALQTAASFVGDSELVKSDVRNAGAAIAITPGRGVVAGRWVIVTRETTTGTGTYNGLPLTLHVTYAILTRHDRRWIVSSWSPQN